MSRKVGGHNKAVRFYFDDWEAETDGLSRLEWALLLEVCVHNWKKREPMLLGLLFLDFATESEREAWESLVRKGKVVIENGRCSAPLVRKMIKHNSLNRMATDLWREVRSRIFERDNYTCTYCGKYGGHLECDHRFPLSLGGSNDDDNLTTACRPCNRKKAQGRRKGWGGYDPQETQLRTVLHGRLGRGDDAYDSSNEGRLLRYLLLHLG